MKTQKLAALVEKQPANFLFKYRGRSYSFVQITKCECVGRMTEALQINDIYLCLELQSMKFRAFSACRAKDMDVTLI